MNRIDLPYKAPPISPYDPTTIFRVLTSKIKQYRENIANPGRSKQENNIPPFSNLLVRRGLCGQSHALGRNKTPVPTKDLSSSKAAFVIVAFPFPE